MGISQHHIRRDEIAVRLRGQTEFNVGGVFVDVAVCRQKNAIDLIEVKSNFSDLNRSIGQIVIYDGVSGRSSGRTIVCIVMPVDLEERSQFVRWIDRMRSIRQLSFEIQTFDELVNLPDGYEIAGQRFPDRLSMLTYGRQIKTAYSYAEYLCPEYRDFLLAIGDGYARRHWHCPAVDVSLSRIDTGIMLTVHSSDRAVPLSVEDCIRAWMEMEHYRWASCPTHVGVCR